jgi:hypothetical protein
MLKVIEDQPVIKKYVRQFVKGFKPFVDEEIKVKLGHQGASFPAKVLWSKKLGIWKFSRTIKGIRYWNAFGVGKPLESNLLSITAEINFPWAGIDRKTGGAFARDYWGNIFVIHRGKIGGGKKGVGKALFEHSYRGVWSFMEDEKAVTQVAIIGALNSHRFALQAAQFVKKIEKLKSTARTSTQTEINFSEITFREDLVGSAPHSTEDEIIFACDRDLVISDLAALLQRQKLKIGNDTERELFVVDPSKNRISHIFALVTDTSEKNILAAAAKLLLQTSVDVGNPLPVLVLPEDKIADYEQEMQRINISIAAFCWEGEKVVFPELEKIDFK